MFTMAASRAVDDIWRFAVLDLVGESLPCAEHVVGVRIWDRGRSHRLEVWLSTRDRSAVAQARAWIEERIIGESGARLIRTQEQSHADTSGAPQRKRAVSLRGAVPLSVRDATTLDVGARAADPTAHRQPYHHDHPRERRDRDNDDNNNNNNNDNNDDDDDDRDPSDPASSVKRRSARGGRRRRGGGGGGGGGGSIGGVYEPFTVPSGAQWEASATTGTKRDGILASAPPVLRRTGNAVSESSRW